MPPSRDSSPTLAAYSAAALSEPNARASTVLWLSLGTRCIELPPGRSIIGRVLDADVILDDLQVSRRHAEIFVDKGRALLSDLGSSNGTRLNAQRVTSPVQLRPSDVISIARWQLEFHETTRAEFDAAASQRGSQGATLTHIESRRSASPTEKTATERALDLMGELAQKALAIGRADEAERVLGPQLAEILSSARLGTGPTPENADRAAALALRLAEGSGRGNWVRYTFELFTALGRALPDTAVDTLYTLVRTVTFDKEALDAYVERLRERQPRMSPSERFVLHRLEGLARMVSP